MLGDQTFGGHIPFSCSPTPIVCLNNISALSLSSEILCISSSHRSILCPYIVRKLSRLTSAASSALFSSPSRSAEGVSEPSDRVGERRRCRTKGARERAACRREAIFLNAIRICDIAGDLVSWSRRTERDVRACNFVECDGAARSTIVVSVSQSNASN